MRFLKIKKYKKIISSNRILSFGPLCVAKKIFLLLDYNEVTRYRSKTTPRRSSIQENQKNQDNFPNRLS